LASSYLNEAGKLWSYASAQAWQEDPELAMNLLTITAEVALGRRTATSVIDDVSHPAVLMFFSMLIA
jgi:hypothetical protein